MGLIKYCVSPTYTTYKVCRQYRITQTQHSLTKTLAVRKAKATNTDFPGPKGKCALGPTISLTDVAYF